MTECCDIILHHSKKWWPWLWLIKKMITEVIITKKDGGRDAAT